MNYQDYVQELAILLPQQLVSPFVPAAPFNDPDYNTILPRCIEYAELMMYRDPDLNFLYTRQTVSTNTFAAGSRNFTLPTAIIIAERIAAITPDGQQPATGTRVQYLPTSLDFIDFIWPTESTTAAPGAVGYPGPYFAMKDNVTAVVAPTPDNNYTVEVTGVFRPAPLSSSNTTTYISSNLPDLFIAASMIYMSGVMKDYGSQADDPKLATSWTMQYETLKKGAAIESARQRQQSANWSPFPPTSFAVPPRS